MRLYRAVPVSMGIIGVAVIAISVTAGPPPQAPPATTRTSAATDPVSALQREVDLLKEQVRRPQVVVSPPGAAQGSDVKSASPEPESAPPPVSDIDPVRVAALLDVHHAREPADRVWSDALRADLSAVLDARHAGTRVSATACATSLCKVTVVHETLAAQQELASTIASLPALSAGVFYSYQNTESPPRTVLYVVREGHDISEMFAAQ